MASDNTDILNKIASKLDDINKNLTNLPNLINSKSLVSGNYYYPITKILQLPPGKISENVFSDLINTDGVLQWFSLYTNSNQFAISLTVNTKNTKSKAFQISNQTLEDYYTLGIAQNPAGIPWLSTYDTTNNTYVLSSTPAPPGLEYSGRITNPILLQFNNTTSNTVDITFLALFKVVED